MQISDIRYRSNGNYVLSEVAGEPVIVPVSKSVADMEKMLLLNDTSRLIMNGVEQGLTIAGIASLMAQEYDVEESEAQADIHEFLQSMAKYGYVSEVE